MAASMISPSRLDFKKNFLGCPFSVRKPPILWQDFPWMRTMCALVLLVGLVPKSMKETRQ
jgi:hypothetical protein